jgi:hypothetical protein
MPIAVAAGSPHLRSRTWIHSSAKKMSTAALSPAAPVPGLLPLHPELRLDLRDGLLRRLGALFVEDLISRRCINAALSPEEPPMSESS